MKVKEYLLLYVCIFICILSLLVLGGDRVEGMSDVYYWSFKGGALVVFGIGLYGLKSLEGKYPKE